MGAERLLASTATRDLVGFTLLVLISAGAVGYALLQAHRTRTLVRLGWAGVRSHPAPLVGLLCGVAVLAVWGVYLYVTWLEGWSASNAIWSAHRWQTLPMIACGFAFTWTDPGRQPTERDRIRAAFARAHPWQWRGGFLVALGTWGLLPLAAVLPSPAGFVAFLLCPLALLAEIVYASWWWARYGQFEEISDAGRTVYLPTYAVHPAFEGWLWGTVASALFWVTLADILAGR